MSGDPSDVCFLPATRQLELLRGRELSCVELVAAHIATIEHANPVVNAIVTETFELAERRARDVDVELAAGIDGGPLQGLPVAHKDVTATKGIRTTLGSPLHADDVPDADALIVERLRGAGAVTMGKTNTPEFAAGSQTYNRVFGATRNPYDPALTCGGSSGGAAAALASGMVAIADGTDMGGSLRNPASFCNVVGLRPSPGRVPAWPTPSLWEPLGVHGPMGRTVGDVALQLQVIAGADARAPLASGASGVPPGASLERDLAGVRVAWSRTLGGLPVDPAVTAVLEAGRPVLEALGCVVEEVEPDFSGAEEAFTAWRAWLFELSWGRDYDDHREELGADVRWNVEQGRALTGPQLAEAERRRTALIHRLRGFLETREFLLAPVVQVLPFPVEQHYPATVAGVPMESYIDWMKSCYVVSAAALPAASVPFGFTPDGLPVGLQVIGRHGADWSVLQLAHAIERESGHWRRRPPITGEAEASLRNQG
jgi:amidase